MCWREKRLCRFLIGWKMLFSGAEKYEQRSGAPGQFRAEHSSISKTFCWFEMMSSRIFHDTMRVTFIADLSWMSYNLFVLPFVYFLIILLWETDFQAQNLPSGLGWSNTTNYFFLIFFSSLFKTNRRKHFIPT